jgi:hypothetical protein
MLLPMELLQAYYVLFEMKMLMQPKYHKLKV